MKSFKVTVTEIDGNELEYATEYNLAQAIQETGVLDSLSGFCNVNRILCNEKREPLFDQNGNILLGV